MSGQPVDIINLETVALTKEKQAILLDEFERYVRATNSTIKMILKKRMTSPTKTIELLHTPLTNKYILDDIAEENSEVRYRRQLLQFAKRFDYSTVTNVVSKDIGSPEAFYMKFASMYLEQYVSDIVKTARVEIGKHRKMAKIVRSMRDKTPYFKKGRMILSGILVWIDDRSAKVLTSTGTLLPLPFDKRTRNRESVRLEQIRDSESEDSRLIKGAYDRVRITWNDEGYLNVDIRVQKKRT